MQFSRIEIERFESRFVKVSSGCWEWTSTLNYKGYGKFNYKNGASAHRFSFIHYKGGISKELYVDHICRNRKCVNPDHLRAVTPQQNSLWGQTVAAANAKKTHCPKGHPYSEENTYKNKNNNGRLCRTCLLTAKRAYNKKYAEKVKLDNRERFRRKSGFYDKTFPPVYKKCAHHKLTPDDVIFIRKASKEGVKREVLSKQFNVTPENIWNVIGRKTWKHLP